MKQTELICRHSSKNTSKWIFNAYFTLLSPSQKTFSLLFFNLVIKPFLAYFLFFNHEELPSWVSFICEGPLEFLHCFLYSVDFVFFFATLLHCNAMEEATLAQIYSWGARRLTTQLLHCYYQINFIFEIDYLPEWDIYIWHWSFS